MKIAIPGPVGQRQWTPLTATNAGLAFGLELGMLAALCYWGFKTGSTLATRLLLGIGAPALAATVWGLFLAAGGPKFRQPLGVEIALKVLVLETAALALHASGRSTLAVVFAVLAVVSVAVEYTTR
ncbi:MULTISPECIES: YrdB family protein [Kitasatospora]|uniref:YrdB family protein n=1 Tax=Kitasatospora cathayae TaxID=3004092 RepID=A0ABY7QCF7_9ACTN|nr:YrdB family protein [Kitasatospora sp. HUAS 3-15]WBP89796.1 YrdB family protein [Kitasatospora sp. HUAS 3-15]